MLTDLHIFSTPDYEEVVFGIPSICIHGFTPHQHLNGWTDIIHICYARVYSSQVSAQGIRTFQLQEIGAIWIGSKTQNSDFLTNGSTAFD